LGGATLAATLGFTSAVDNVYTIISNDGTDPVVGNFAGLPPSNPLPTLTIGGVVFEVNYAGGDGNDVTLQHKNTNSAFAGRTGTSPINENGVAILSGNPVDPDPLDTFTLIVNWGDGPPTETFSSPPQTPLVTLPHQYLDN